MIDGLSNRLRQSRLNTDLTRKQVAEILVVSESLVGLYESGVRQPSLTALIKLASLYKVSTDFLLGVKSAGKNLISLDGLNEKQVQGIKMILQLFREQST